MENKQITIHHNDEVGFPLFSLCSPGNFPNWIKSLKDFKKMVAYTKKHYPDFEIKIVCSIPDCKTCEK